MSLFLNLLISSIGLGYFMYGKKVPEFSFMIAGLLMMIYPYLITGPVISLFIGIVLGALPIVLKRIA